MKDESEIGRTGAGLIHPSSFILVLQCSSLGLFALDGFEECFEVSLAETARPSALNDLEEERGSILDRLGEDLKQIALVVAIDQDAELGQLIEILFDRAGALGQQVIVGPGYLQERHV